MTIDEAISRLEAKAQDADHMRDLLHLALMHIRQLEKEVQQLKGYQLEPHSSDKEHAGMI